MNEMEIPAIRRVGDHGCPECNARIQKRPSSTRLNKMRSRRRDDISPYYRGECRPRAGISEAQCNETGRSSDN